MNKVLSNTYCLDRGIEIDTDEGLVRIILRSARFLEDRATLEINTPDEEYPIRIDERGKFFPIGVGGIKVRIDGFVHSCPRLSFSFPERYASLEKNKGFPGEESLYDYKPVFIGEDNIRKSKVQGVAFETGTRALYP